MDKSLIFWVIMLIWALCIGGLLNPAWRDRVYIGGNVVLFILLALLGWVVFGPAVR
jgi:hypothetical protein